MRKYLTKFCAYINSCIKSGNRLSPHLYGFLKNRGTINNLITIYDYVTANLDLKLAVDILYFDCSKAFDTIPHDRLIMKLRKFNINVFVVNWISNYLQNRNQL